MCNFSSSLSIVRKSPCKSQKSLTVLPSGRQSKRTSEIQTWTVCTWCYRLLCYAIDYHFTGHRYSQIAPAVVHYSASDRRFDINASTLTKIFDPERWGSRGSPSSRIEDMGEVWRCACGVVTATWHVAKTNQFYSRLNLSGLLKRGFSSTCMRAGIAKF